jgi:hypothetical protein
MPFHITIIASPPEHGQILARSDNSGDSDSSTLGQQQSHSVYIYFLK